MDTILNNRLAVLAAEIKQLQKNVDDHDALSFKSQMEIAKRLWEARQMFPADREFGHWVADVELDTISRHNRAGYIWMAQRPEWAEYAYTEKELRSPRYIGEYIRDRLEREPAGVATSHTEPEGTKLPETTPTIPVEPVIEIVPEAIIEATPDPEPEPQDLGMVPVTLPPVVMPVFTPVTPPSNPMPRNPLLTLPSPPAKKRRVHRLDPFFKKDLGKVDLILSIWGDGRHHKSLGVVISLCEKPANRPVVIKMAETIKANNWVPGETIYLTPTLMNRDLQLKGTYYNKQTPANIEACINEALALDRKLRGETDPDEELRKHEAYQAMLARLKASASPLSKPEDAGTRFNTPAADEAIAVYGNVIREAGAHPEVYQDWWQGASLVFHILEVFGPLDPAKLRNVGHSLMTARHWLRGIDVYQLELVLGEVGNAMLNAKDDSRLVSAPANVRHADK